ncbi:MAG: WD40 repeat domain-containing serine/threonine protein kinase [Oscillochloridaceae bacterium umkhey_bin13]
MQDLVGHSLDHYQIVARLGEGGMATVYKAQDLRLERLVALKVIRADLAAEATFMARFEHEARAMARLDHPNIVRVFSYGQAEGCPYLVMEYLPGGSLSDRTGSPLDPREALMLLAPVARALAYAHQQQLIHRDVKPANILLNADGQPLLADFGIARLLERGQTPGLTATGFGIGTPEYMAPEQWDGRTEPASDTYALGVVLYELLTGHTPYEADTPAAVLIRQLHEPLPSVRFWAPMLPVEVEQVLLKALARTPTERFSSMDEFATALEQLAHRIAPPQPLPPPRRSRRTLLGLGGLVLLLVVGLFLLTRLLSSAPAILPAMESAAPDPLSISAVAETPLTAPAPTASSAAVAILVTAVAAPPQPTTVPQSAAVMDVLRPTVQAFFKQPEVQEPLTSTNLERLQLLTSLSPAEDPITALRINAVRWSPDGQRLGLVIGGRLNSITTVGVLTHDAASIEPICWTPASLISSRNWAFSPDGRWLALPLYDPVKTFDQATIALWDLAQCREVWQLGPVHTAGPGAYILAFAPDAQLLAFTDPDHNILLWDLANSRQRQVLRGHSESILNLAFAPDGSQLVSVAEDGTARVWDVERGARIHQLIPDDGTQLSASPIIFWPDGEQLSIASHFFDRASGRWLQRNDDCCGVLSPDKRLFAQLVQRISEGRLATLYRMLNADTFEVLHHKDSPALSSTYAIEGEPLTFAPDGRLLVVTANNGWVDLWGVVP